MKFIIRPRGAGKTEQLVAWAKQPPEGEARIIICHSLQYVGYMQRKNPDMASWQFVTLDDLNWGGGFEGVRLTRHVRLGIDNLDLLIPRIVKGPFPVELITATGEKL